MRKGLYHVLYRVDGRGLQWGRNLTVAEGDRNVLDVRASARLQWGRNLTVAEGSYTCAVNNLPAALQWGRNLTVAEGRATIQACSHSSMLQWGRNLTVAEGSRSLLVPINAKEASMGPQLDSCGRRFEPLYRGRELLLQWGRNLTVAEGWAGLRSRQWDRGFNGAAT